MADHLADLLLAPTPAAMANLATRGPRRSRRAGRRRDGRRPRLGDRPRRRAPAAGRAAEHERLRPAHPPPRRERRRSRSASPRSSTASPSGCPVIFPVHPRTRGALERAGRRLPPNVIAIEPVGYLEMVALEARGRGHRHRLGRRPEGGLPAGRAVRHAAVRDRVGRDRRGRLEPRRRRRSDRACRRPRRRGASCDRDRPRPTPVRRRGRRASYRCGARATPRPRAAGARTAGGDDPSDPDRSPADGRGGEAARVGGDGLRHRWRRDRAWPSSRSAFAAMVGVPHAVATSSGTTALHLALLGLRHRPRRRGDHRAVHVHRQRQQHRSTPARGRSSSTCDEDDFTIDVGQVEAAITPRTKAIMPVSLYGQPADLPALAAIAERHGLAVVEDAGQAHGAAIGERRSGQLGRGDLQLLPDQEHDHRRGRHDHHRRRRARRPRCACCASTA